MSDWFKKWFSSDEYLSVYAHRNTTDAKNLINLVFNNLPFEKKKNIHILDAACGAGRHSILLALKNHNVTAFDLSKNLLEIGLKNAKELDAHVNFICSDIRYVKFKKKFDLILNMFTSFGYFETDSDNFSFYKNAFDFLTDNGFIVFDYFNVNYLTTNLVPESVKRINGRKIKEVRFIENGFVKKCICIENNGKTHEFKESVKLYTFAELERHFNMIGFKVFKIFGDYNGNQFDLNNSERLIILFRK